MNTINSLGPMAMDGQNIQNIANAYKNSAPKSVSKPQEILISPDGSEVAQNIAQTKEDIKADTHELQKLSDMVMGRKVQFNVNDELGSVVVRIVDSNTDTVIKEIPSPEIQKLKINIRKAIGIIFDDII